MLDFFAKEIEAGENMKPTRTIASVAGVMFVLATIAALLAAAADPILTGTDYVSKICAKANSIRWDALLYIIAAFSSAGIAITLYPVLKGVSASLAIGSVVFRAIEAVFYMVAVICLLSLVSLSQRVISADAVERTSLLSVCNLLLTLREHATLLGVFSFNVGAFMYYYLFFQARLIPRWLSGWGIFAVVLMMVACVLALLGDHPITGYTFLVLPIALQEIVLAVWLMVKGFRMPTIESDPAGA
jgi:hypothetical protein